jgi:hypothetical protein
MPEGCAKETAQEFALHAVINDETQKPCEVRLGRVVTVSGRLQELRKVLNWRAVWSKNV